MELFPFFHQIVKILILFVLYFKNYKRQVVSWNCKHLQHVKIYLPCNFEINPITHFDRLCKLEKRGDEILKKISSETTGPIAIKLLWNDPWMAPFQNCVRWSPTSNQNGRQAKNRKKGGWNYSSWNAFFVDSLLLVTQIIKGKQLYYKMWSRKS